MTYEARATAASAWSRDLRDSDVARTAGPALRIVDDDGLVYVELLAATTS